MASDLEIFQRTPDIEQLITTLDKLIIELNQDPYGEYWAKWMLSARQQIQRDKFNGILSVLNAYGSAGSISDGIYVPECDQLVSEAWRLARKIKADFEASNLSA